MALQYEIDDVSELDESVQSLYQKDDESGKYRLAVEGIDDGKELKDALRKEREERAARQKRIDELEEEQRKVREDADKARLEAAKKNGDTEALEKSWQEKLAAREAELQAELEKYQGTVVKLTSGQTATKLAADLAVQGSADVLMPHIERRLKTEYREGQPTTVVLDKDGKPSAMTVDELKQEFMGNKAFAPLIAGTKATGAGRTGGDGSGATGKSITRADFDQLNHVERAAFVRDGGKITDED